MGVGIIYYINYCFIKMEYIMAYIFLSLSFVFLCLCIEQAVKKPQEYNLVGKFAFISLIFNVLSMFLFPWSSGYRESLASHRVGNGVASDTHRGGNGIYLAPEDMMGVYKRREKLHDDLTTRMRSMNEDLDSMNSMTTDMLVDLAEIKAILLCSTPDQSSDFGLDSGTGVSETPSED
jgi:hypothetical protein